MCATRAENRSSKGPCRPKHISSPRRLSRVGVKVNVRRWGKSQPAEPMSAEPRETTIDSPVSSACDLSPRVRGHPGLMQAESAFDRPTPACAGPLRHIGTRRGKQKSPPAARYSGRGAAAGLKLCFQPASISIAKSPPGLSRGICDRLENSVRATAPNPAPGTSPTSTSVPQGHSVELQVGLLLSRMLCGRKQLLRVELVGEILLAKLAPDHPQV